MKRRVRAVVLAGVMAVSATLAGCSGGDGDKKTGGPLFSRSEADTIVQVTAKNFSYVDFPTSVKGPKVFFEMSNEDGQTGHELQIVTSEGMSVGGIPPVRPDETKTVALSLPPGQYFAQCMVLAVDTRHADLGMMAIFNVE